MRLRWVQAATRAATCLVRFFGCSLILELYLRGAAPALWSPGLAVPLGALGFVTR